MVELKSKGEIDIMREANQKLSHIRTQISAMAEEGVTTEELDRAAEDLMRKAGGTPTFKGYRGFPASICVSVNEEVVHGIPGKRKLKSGDVVGLDMGLTFRGYVADTALTKGIGAVSETAKRLMTVTEQSLYRGIEAAQPGAHLHDIGAAIQAYCEAEGFSVVREFVGHGIGRKLHEDPQVPNFGKSGTGPKLLPGMVLAIEPMINEGKPGVRILSDGWTAVTEDGTLSAHYEHSIAIHEEGPEILSR